MEEKKIMEFKETDETMEDTIKEAVMPVEVPKKGLLAKWKSLKWWQKAAIIAGTASLIYVGGKWIFKTKKGTKAVVPMETVNNAADAAFQAAEEAGANVVNF